MAITCRSENFRSLRKIGPVRSKPSIILGRSAFLPEDLFCTGWHIPEALIPCVISLIYLKMTFQENMRVGHCKQIIGRRTD
jgi:hypothetical protein